MTPAISTDDVQIKQGEAFRVSRGVRALLVTTFLALIYCVPVVEAGLDLAGGETPKVLSIFTTMPSQANLRSYERALENSSRAAKAIRPWIQAATGWGRDSQSLRYVRWSAAEPERELL
jgi:hypothetical protein